MADIDVWLCFQPVIFLIFLHCFECLSPSFCILVGRLTLFFWKILFIYTLITIDKASGFLLSMIVPFNIYKCVFHISHRSVHFCILHTIIGFAIRKITHFFTNQILLIFLPIRPHCPTKKKLILYIVMIFTFALDLIIPVLQFPLTLFYA